MPKMKTVSSAKTTKQKRNLTHVTTVDGHNLKAVRKMLVM